MLCCMCAAKCFPSKQGALETHNDTYFDTRWALHQPGRAGRDRMSGRDLVWEARFVAFLLVSNSRFAEQAGGIRNT